MIRRPHAYAVLAAASLSALFAAVTRPDAEPLNRGALWKVVRLCTTAARVTGQPFPCLAVRSGQGAGPGYVVLRPPFGPADTILAPAQPISGVEDPQLLDPGIPNYFAAAWRERALALTLTKSRLDDGWVALAVNAKTSRSQDQLHIHIGCLAPETRRAIERVAPRLPIGTWVERAGVVGSAQPLRLYRTCVENVDDVEPFRLLGQEPGMTKSLRARTMLALVNAQIGKHREFVVITSKSSALSPLSVTAEDFAHADCGRVDGQN